jgi:hypothetical protein
VSPWSNRVLLALTRNHAADASPLVAIDRRSGRVLWTVVPDLQEMRDAFGPEIMDAGSMSPARLVVADLFADHEPVLVVLFHHSLYYPASLCVVDARGRSLAQYANKGHIFEMHVADLDRDGTSELVVLGTNNDPAYQGATIIILDEFHFRGASTDAVATPASTVPDSARIRLILPQFEARFMELLDLDRLNARNARLMPREDGTTGLSVEIGHVRDRSRLIVFLDAQLNPLGTDINDDLKLRIRRTWPDSLQLAGPGDPRWRRNWLASHVRFEAGHWPPGDASQDLRPPVDDLTVSGDRPVPPSP